MSGVIGFVKARINQSLVVIVIITYIFPDMIKYVPKSFLTDEICQNSFDKVPELIKNIPCKHISKNMVVRYLELGGKLSNSLILKYLK